MTCIRAFWYIFGCFVMKSGGQRAEEARKAARELSENGVTLRDIGRLMGVSYQRAHQLVANS